MAKNFKQEGDTLTLTPIAVPRTSDGPDARDFVSATAAGSAGRSDSTGS